jgi:predicted Rossmann-fold nucleotide-binding protein
MDGALEAGAHGKQARMIGILPNKGKGAETIKSNPNTRCLLLHTTLSNYQRNCLTGCLADGLIALKGDAGTLSEVGLALEAGKPVVFLDSHAHLRSKLEDPAIMTDLKKILKDVKCIRPAMDTERIIRRLSDMLGDENVSTHATEPANAVQIALGKVASGTAEMASPSRALLGLEERAVSPGEFEKELLSLCKRGSS